MSFPPEVEASYAAIIDSILSASDLNTITAKNIRKGLQAQVGYDITPQKKEITQLIMSRFDKFNSERNGDAPPAAVEPPPTAAAPVTESKPAAPATNGVAKPSVTPKKRSEPVEEEEDQSSSVSTSDRPSAPPPKKHKRNVSQSMEEDDAAYAARLQAELDRLNRARSTRGGGRTKQKPVGKKDKVPKKKKKSAAKVNSEDDSEVDSTGEKKEVKKTGGFHKPMTLSEPLSELLGETQLSRPQTVKKIWDYVKARDLQDPADKRQIRCDEAMRAVFKTERVHMFTMNKILNQNLYAQDE